MKHTQVWWLRARYLLGFLTLIAVGIVACGGGDTVDTVSSTATESVSASTSTTLTVSPAWMPTATAQLIVTELATSLSSPWSLAFLPDGRMLVTERAGKLLLVSSSGTASAVISGVPTVNSIGQGGLLDVVLDPAYASNQRIYFSYSEIDAINASLDGTAVARARLDVDGLRLTEMQVIYRQSPKVASAGHYGSRLVFDKSGHLFVTLGERAIERDFAQDLRRGHGKVMRITTDGAPAPGNPIFTSVAGAQAGIWSYGHRNPQGAALHPLTGELWVNEHGAQGGDELNLVLPGKNYGWPLASYSQEYGTTTPVGTTSLPGMTAPVSYWITRDGSAYKGGAQSSIAPSGMAIYAGDKFPEYQGNVFIGALAGAALWRVGLGGTDGRTEIARERLLDARNERIRDVRVGPDGWIYLLTDGTPGKLLRLSK